MDERNIDEAERPTTYVHMDEEYHTCSIEPAAIADHLLGK